MRFAALQGGGASDYARAGKAVSGESVNLFNTQRKYGPAYDEIAKTGMKARSAEKRTAMEAGAHVTRAGIKAVSDVTREQIYQQGKQEMRNIDAKMRKAGSIAALGQVGAAAMLMKDNTKGRKRPSNTDDLRTLFSDYRNSRDSLIEDYDSKRTKFDAPEYKPGASTGTPSTSGETGGVAGKGSTGADSLLSGNQKTVADAIAKYESGDWGYEAFNQGGAAGGTRVVGKSGSHKEQFGTSLTDMTLSDIFKRQNTEQQGLSMQQHLDSGGLHAVGRYQFIGSTLQDEVKRMGLDPTTTKFTPKVQDDIFMSHIRRVGDISPWVGPSNNYSASQKEQFRTMIAGF